MSCQSYCHHSKSGPQHLPSHNVRRSEGTLGPTDKLLKDRSRHIPLGIWDPRTIIRASDPRITRRVLRKTIWGESSHKGAMMQNLQCEELRKRLEEVNSQRILCTWDSSVHESFLNSAFICDVSVGGEVKGTTWGDSSSVNEYKCQLNGFCAFRNSGAHSPHPHLYSHAIQHNLAGSTYLKCSFDWLHHSCSKNFRGFPPPQAKLNVYPACWSQTSCTTHSHYSYISISQEAFIFRGHVSFYFVKSFQRLMFLFPWSRQGQ